MGILEGRRIVVTGGASGIGRATTAVAAREGARVAVWDLHGDGAKASAEEVGGVGLRCDVSDESQIEAAMVETCAELGGVDGLLNAAGIFVIDGGISSCTLEQWNHTIAVNLTAAFLVSKYFVTHRDRDKDAAIVNIASVYGLRGLKDEAAYDASKGGIVNLTRQMALELAEHRIRVNAVAPGEIDTPMTLTQLKDGEDPDELRRRLGATVPMRRMGRADEVGEVIVFLLSSRASYVSGTTLPIDGGLIAG